MSKKLVCLYLTEYSPLMKKLALIIFLASAVFNVACTREFNCQCLVKYTGNHPGLPDSSIHEFAIKNKKKEAKKQCEANSSTVTQFDVTMEEKCQLY